MSYAIIVNTAEWPWTRRTPRRAPSSGSPKKLEEESSHGGAAAAYRLVEKDADPYEIGRK